MAGVGIANYWASVGVKTDDKALRDVDEYLRKIENKLKKGQSAAGKGLVLNVSINQRMLRKSIADTIEKGVFRAQITPILSKSSLAAVRQQIQSLFTTPISVKVNVPKQTASSSGGSRSSSRKMDGYNQDAFNPNPWGGSKGGPSILERIRGRPEKGSLSAANRRYFDATGKSIFSSGNSITGWIGETLGGGLVSQGASTMAGRAGITLASSLGGMRAGGFVGAGLGLATLGVKGAGMAWNGLVQTLTAPFQLVSSAASAVTGAFYRIALAAAPLAIGFNAIDTRVRENTLKGVALGTMAEKYGSTGKAERDWLMNMSNRDGVEYSSLIDPFTSFLSASAPAMGLNNAKSTFEAITQYGITHGANAFSMQNALKAFGQMSGKGTVQLEELKNQIGDAQGFGGMLPIFAEAWQQLQGKTGSNALTGDKAIKALLEATQKGQVVTAKILPYVEQIARAQAEPGLWKMRNSSNAERARFKNQINEGWNNFGEGGGEKGLQFFWKMMQNFSSWFEKNGNSLGNYFNILMVDLNTLRVGLKELFEFAWTGKSNDLVEIAKENGFDLPKIRDSLLQLFDSIGVLVKQVLKSLGFDTGNGLVAGLGAKILRFTEDLNKVFVSLTEMFKYLGTVFSEFGRISEMGYTELAFAASPVGVGLGAAGAYNNPFVNIAGAISKAGAAFGQATVGAGTATVNALTQPGMTPQGNYNPIANPQLNLLPPSNPLQMYTPLMQNQLSTPQKLEGNVNITLTVEGNSDLAAQLNTPQVQSIIRKTTQEGISNMLLQAVPTAPIN